MKNCKEGLDGTWMCPIFDLQAQIKIKATKYTCKVVDQIILLQSVEVLLQSCFDLLLRKLLQQAHISFPFHCSVLVVLRTPPSKVTNAAAVWQFHLQQLLHKRHTNKLIQLSEICEFSKLYCTSFVFKIITILWIADNHLPIIMRCTT